MALPTLTPPLLYTADNTAGMQLAQPYTVGSGVVILTAPPSFTASSSAPVAIALITAATYATRGVTEVKTIYYCTGVSGTTLTLAGVLPGFVDQGFSTGDYCESRGCAAVFAASQVILASITSATQGGIPYVNNAGVLAFLPPGISGYVFSTGGTGANPGWIAPGGGGGGGGTVTSVSVVSANGLSGSVANAGSTPSITLSTSITGVLKGTSGAVAAAAAGTDFQAPISLTTTGTSGAATFSGNTLNIPDYATNTSITLTTTGTSGAATLTGSTLNIPQYASGTGTVTTISVASANGLAGSVANPTTTPVITLSTPVAGILKGTSGSIAAATAGTDYQAPISLTTTGTSGAATFSGGTLNVPNYAIATGTVTTVSVVNANGLTGSVANPTTSPALTLSTTVTGLMKGSAGTITAATAGTDYQAAVTATGVLKGTGTAIVAATAGTDYQVGVTATGVLKGTGTAVVRATAGTDYQGPVALTTTGTGGAATFNATTGALNIPNYAAGSGTPITSLTALLNVSTGLGFVVNDPLNTTQSSLGTTSLGTLNQILGAPTNGQLISWASNVTTPVTPAAGMNITGSNLNATLTPVAAVKTANYTAAANDFVMCDVSGGAFTVTLPTAPADKTRIGIKLVNVAATTNVLTFVTGGSDVINFAGTTSGTLSLKNQTVQFQYDSALAIWYVIAADNSHPYAAGSNITIAIASGVPTISATAGSSGILQAIVTSPGAANTNSTSAVSFIAGSSTYTSAAWTIAAARPVVGTKIWIELRGVYTGNNSTSRSMRVMLGSTNVCNFINGTLVPPTQTTVGWRMRVALDFQTVGTSGTVDADGELQLGAASAASIVYSMKNPGGAGTPTTVNTTGGSLLLDIQGFQGTASSGESFTCTGASWGYIGN